MIYHGRLRTGTPRLLDLTAGVGDRPPLLLIHRPLHFAPLTHHHTPTPMTYKNVLFYELGYRIFNKTQALAKNCHRMPNGQPANPAKRCVENYAEALPSMRFR